MASYATNEFKSGLKVLVDGEPCSILENEVVKPGKGQAFNRVKFRNLRNSRVWERTFKSGESIEAADVMEIDMEYLYADGEFWHFMKTDGSFEQMAADASAISEAKDWLKEQDVYQVISGTKRQSRCRHQILLNLRSLKRTPAERRYGPGWHQAGYFKLGRGSQGAAVRQYRRCAARRHSHERVSESCQQITYLSSSER